MPTSRNLRPDHTFQQHLNVVVPCGSKSASVATRPAWTAATASSRGQGTLAAAGLGRVQNQDAHGRDDGAHRRIRQRIRIVPRNA
jgi:hypothetical protein